jgi:AcrR family transcriptional regulator
VSEVVPAGPAPAARRPGRPPDLEKRQAILDAAREVLAEVGYASMTIDAVAQRAGSNRVLIYRVWDTKLALARDALLGGDSDFVVPDTGELRADLRDFTAQQVARMTRPAYLMGVPGLTVELMSDARLFRDTYERYVKPSDDGFRTIVARAVERGELARPFDEAVLTRLVSGFVTSLAQSGRHDVEEITDLAVAALMGVLREFS